MAKLGDDMIARADRDGLAAGHEMRVKAALFNEAAEGYYSDPQTVEAKWFIGHWARARRCWCDYTGESFL